MRVTVRRDLCEANALCVGVAPNVFSLSEDEELMVADGDVPAHLESVVREAVSGCPKSALSLTDE